MSLTMHWILVPLIMFTGMTSCNSQVKPKDAPNTIDREATFIKAQLSVKILSKENILVVSEITNSSFDDFHLHRSLLPNSNHDVFGVISETTLEEVTFIGNSNWDDFVDNVTGTVQIDSAKILTIRPGETLRFKVNIAALYDFTKHKYDSFRVVYTVGMPFIKEAKHISEEDTDGIKKPMYYYIYSNREKFSLK